MTKFNTSGQNIDMIIVKKKNTSLDSYKEAGKYFFDVAYQPIDAPLEAVNGYLYVDVASPTDIKQVWKRKGTINSNDHQQAHRTLIGNTWSEWARELSSKEVVNNLNSDRTDLPLSANQGRILNEKVSYIGQVVITSTNTNPSSKYGGTWTLVDKEFKTSKSTKNVLLVYDRNGQSLVSTGNAGIYVSRQGHTINIEASLDNLVEIDDNTIKMFQLGVGSSYGSAGIGVTRLGHKCKIIGYSDGGNCIMMLNINTNGDVECYDIVGADTMPANNTFFFYLSTTVDSEFMIDSFCDKFYWKRTA